MFRLPQVSTTLSSGSIVSTSVVSSPSIAATVTTLNVPALAITGTTQAPTSAAQLQEFSSPPLCAAVWNPASPPAVADPTILATVAAADAQGVFSGGNGPVLQGTVPFDVYIQTVMGVVFGGMPGDTPTAAQQQCLATLGQAMGVNSSLTPIFITDSKCICERSAALTCDPPMSAAADCIVIAPSGDGCPMRPV